MGTLNMKGQGWVVSMSLHESAVCIFWRWDVVPLLGYLHRKSPVSPITTSIQNLCIFEHVGLHIDR